MESDISVERKWVDSKGIKNKAWFIMSSNDPVPLQLDPSNSWNRRFTLIESFKMLDVNISKDMNDNTFNNKETIKEYVSRLYHTYPEVPDLKIFSALDNEEKRNLEDHCNWAWNEFFEWFEEAYPSILKITNKEKTKLVLMYCEDVWENPRDKKFEQKNFDLSLSIRYSKKWVKIRGKTYKWYYIKKDKDWSKTEFNIWEVDNFSIW